MVNAAEVSTLVTVDDTDFDRKMRGIDRRLEKAEGDAKKSARRRGTLMAAGVAGAVAGVVGGAVSQSSPVNSLLQVLLNVVAAALLPILVAMMPLIQTITPLLIKLSETLAPSIRFLAEKAGLLIDIATGKRLDEFGGAARTGNTVADALLVAGTTNLRYPGAVAQGILDPNRTVAENLDVANQDTRESFSTLGSWFGDTASSAWEATVEKFNGIGGAFS